MGSVLWALSESGYDAEWQTISAASVGAPHLRERVFIVAYPNGHRVFEAVARGNSETHQLPQVDWQNYRTARGTVRTSDAGRQSSSSYTQLESAANTNPDGNRLEDGIGRTGTQSQIGAIKRSNNLDGRSNYWATESSVLRVANGVPNRVDTIRGLGNAVVPQVAAIALQRVLDLFENECYGMCGT
jgi:DNA (cytosine-5)-methyltransferase 1